MSVIAKCGIVFESNEGYGWTEIHFRDTLSDTPNLQTELDLLDDKILPRRQPLLGQNCKIVGTRVSFKRDGVVASQCRHTRAILSGTPGQDAASQNDSLALPFFDATGTRHKITHLRGFWDAVEAGEVYRPDLGVAAGWETKLNAYKTALVSNGYGWMSKSALLSVKGAVINYVTQTDGRILFQLANVVGPMPAAGTDVMVKFSRINKSKSVLNKLLPCTVEDAVSFITREPVAAGPFQTKGRFQISVTAFVGYAGMEVPSLGRRSMGSPLLHLAGRSKARPRT